MLMLHCSIRQFYSTGNMRERRASGICGKMFLEDSLLLFVILSTLFDSILIAVKMYSLSKTKWIVFIDYCGIIPNIQDYCGRILNCRYSYESFSTLSSKIMYWMTLLNIFLSFFTDICKISSNKNRAHSLVLKVIAEWWIYFNIFKYSVLIFTESVRNDLYT